MNGRAFERCGAVIVIECTQHAHTRTRVHTHHNMEDDGVLLHVLCVREFFSQF